MLYMCVCVCRQTRATCVCVCVWLFLNVMTKFYRTQPKFHFYAQRLLQIGLRAVVFWLSINQNTAVICALVTGVFFRVAKFNR